MPIYPFTPMNKRPPIRHNASYPTEALRRIWKVPRVHGRCGKACWASSDPPPSTAVRYVQAISNQMKAARSSRGQRTSAVWARETQLRQRPGRRYSADSCRLRHGTATLRGSQVIAVKQYRAIVHPGTWIANCSFGLFSC